MMGFSRIRDGYTVIMDRFLHGKYVVWAVQLNTVAENYLISPILTT